MRFIFLTQYSGTFGGFVRFSKSYGDYVRFSGSFGNYLKKLYGSNPRLEKLSFEEQRQKINSLALDKSDFWTHALTGLGYECSEILINAPQLQKTWAKENLSSSTNHFDPRWIALKQIMAFKPDVLWYDHNDIKLLKEIKAEVPSLKLIFGTTGSAIRDYHILKEIDITLTCAPEACSWLKENGCEAAVLPHAFDPRVIERLNPTARKIGLSFIGRITRGHQYYLNRENFLEKLSRFSNVEIFSPSADFSIIDDIRAVMRQSAYMGMNSMEKFGISRRFFRKIPFIKKAATWESMPVRPMNPLLKPFIRSGVYGLEMFQVLKDSKITLNIHADSSPRYASNFRLWEATGVGTCLLTDWKENMDELFIDGKEVVSYRGVEDCCQKLAWLLAHPQETEEIGKAGQTRTFREHTFAKRAVLFDEIIKRKLKA